MKSTNEGEIWGTSLKNEERVRTNIVYWKNFSSQEKSEECGGGVGYWGRDKGMIGRRSKKNCHTEDMEKMIYSVKWSKIMTLKRSQCFEHKIYWYLLSVVSEEFGGNKDTDYNNLRVNVSWNRGNIIENFKNLGGQVDLKT